MPPWTDLDAQLGRSRDQVLAGVLRRGARLRRRRQAVTGVAAALAALVPVLAFVSFVPRSDGGVHVAAGGPGPSVPTAASSPEPPVSGAVAAVIDPSPPSTPVTAERGTTTIVTTRVDLDDPVVAPTRPAPAPTTTVATAVYGATGSGSSPTSRPSPGPTSDVPPGPLQAPPCPVSQVRITVLTDKATYAPGETVRWTSTLENASPIACMVSGRAFFHVEDASGATVGSFAHTADFQLPVRAEPGRTFTSSLSWDQTTCAKSPCAQVPAGTYTVVAEWTEAGPYVGRGSFAIGS